MTICEAEGTPETRAKPEHVSRRHHNSIREGVGEGAEPVGVAALRRGATGRGVVAVSRRVESGGGGEAGSGLGRRIVVHFNAKSTPDHIFAGEAQCSANTRLPAIPKISAERLFIDTALIDQAARIPLRNCRAGRGRGAGSNGGSGSIGNAEWVGTGEVKTQRCLVISFGVRALIVPAQTDVHCQTACGAPIVLHKSGPVVIHVGRIGHDRGAAVSGRISQQHGSETIAIAGSLIGCRAGIFLRKCNA